MLGDRGLLHTHRRLQAVLPLLDPLQVLELLLQPRHFYRHARHVAAAHHRGRGRGRGRRWRRGGRLPHLLLAHGLNLGLQLLYLGVELLPLRARHGVLICQLPERGARVRLRAAREHEPLLEPLQLSHVLRLARVGEPRVTRELGARHEGGEHLLPARHLRHSRTHARGLGPLQQHAAQALVLCLRPVAQHAPGLAQGGRIRVAHISAR